MDRDAGAAWRRPAPGAAAFDARNGSLGPWTDRRMDAIPGSLGSNMDVLPFFTHVLTY